MADREGQPCRWGWAFGPAAKEGTTMKRPVSILLISAFATTANAEEYVLKNIHSRAFSNECVRVPVEVPGDTCRVELDGKQIPCVVDTVEGEKVLWIRTSIEPGASQKLEISKGKPKSFKSGVTVREKGGELIIDNGKAAVKLPAIAGTEARPPILQVRLRDKWVGKGRWDAKMKLKKFSATIVDEGSVFGKVRLRYEFDAMAGMNDDIPAYAEVDVTLMPNQPFAIIEERHEMDRLSAWEFVTTEGWKATGSIIKPHSGGLGGTHRAKEKKGTLQMGQCAHQDPALMINLFPRWNQHCKDGWLGAAAGEDGAVGALVILAGYWYWPHDNAIQCLVKESGDTMTLRCPTRRGMRYWWLLAGPKELFGNDQKLATRHGLESLDTIINSIAILDWPGKGAKYSGYWPLGNHINPTGGVRGWGRSTIKNAGKAVDSPGHLVQTQWLDSPHVYGSYWLYWSPENPNFFTDFNKVPIGMYCNLKNHPQFKQLAKMALQKFREDMYHSITMPSGAGNECPGYQQYAMHHYLDIAKVCKQYLGEDATQWPRFKAGAGFAIHLSQPRGDGRRGSHPGGDTHGGYRFKDPRAFAKEFGVEEDVTKFKSEELQGFGAVLRNKCGTGEETYFAFKSGPSRGHFHGDQLAFHYAANARRVAVDFGCSYGPRGAMEHMHNRLAFSTRELPYACMDGYERLIAFKTSDDVDMAMGQVESWRLRGVKDIGSENWHDEWPLMWFEDKPLTYRRTVVLLKGSPDIFVIRDQYDAPIELDVAYPLHVFNNDTVTKAPKAKDLTMDGKSLTSSSTDFAELGVQPGWVVTFPGRFMDNQYAVVRVAGKTLTLDRPVTIGSDRGECLLLRPLYEEDGQTINFKAVSLFRAHPSKATTRFFPWFHYNGGLEASQGIRLETRGKEGEYVTVLVPRSLVKGDVAKLSLKGALIQMGRKEKKPLSQGAKKDLLATLTWAGGKLMQSDMLLSAPDFNKGRHSGTVSATGKPPTVDFEMDLTLGRDKWMKGGTAKLKGSIKVDGDKISGNYEGNYSGEPVSGAIEGTYAKNVTPPVAVFAEHKLPELASIPGGVRIDKTEVVFGGGIDDDDATVYVTVRKAGSDMISLSGRDIDMNRSQGEVGLFVPDAGYPFGEIPNWLVRQRIKVPDWAPEWAKRIRNRKQ